MSGSALMSLGTRAMFAASAGLQTTGHNIANANVAGYSRQTVETQTSAGQFTGAGFFGKGADVVGVVRAYDEQLTRQAANTLSQSSYDRTRLEQLQRLEQTFGLGEQGIGHAVTQMFGALSDVASRPLDLPSRSVVLARAGEVAARFNSAAASLGALQDGVTNDFRLQVAEANQIAGNIASVNRQIAELKGLDHAPNDLLDQRDQLINRLSSLIQVTTVAADDGTLGVFVAGGQRLVLGDDAASLRPIGDPDNPKRSALGIVAGGVLRVIPADGIGGGSLDGLLRFQNDDLQAGVQMLDQLAQSLVERVNAQQALGWDQLGNPGEALFTPVDPLLASPALSLRVAITDPRGLAAASATADNGNALALTALRDEAFVDTARFPDTTFAEAYAQLVGEIGVRVQGAMAASDISAAVAASAETARASKSGVNLDEEAAMLIQFQQSYQAAAKVLQIAQSVFQELLDTAGR
jgi:flagellar hook-associated protein 1 FlgK